MFHHLRYLPVYFCEIHTGMYLIHMVCFSSVCHQSVSEARAVLTIFGWTVPNAQTHCMQNSSSVFCCLPMISMSWGKTECHHFMVVYEHMRKGVETKEEIPELWPCAQQGTRCHMKCRTSLERTLRKRTPLTAARKKKMRYCKKITDFKGLSRRLESTAEVSQPQACLFCLFLSFFPTTN